MARCRWFVAMALLAFHPLSIRSAPIDQHFGKSCTAAECHPTAEANRFTIDHVPFFEEWCDRCHTDHTSGEPGLLRETKSALCLPCHIDVEAGPVSVAHPPGNEACTDCHDPHRSSIRHLLRSEQQLLACSQCHEEDLERAARRPFTHDYFDPETECGSCHYAHQKAEQSFLRENVGETCLTCHDLPIMAEGTHLEDVGKTIREMPFVHSPAADLECAVCHTPHGANQPALLRLNYPAGSYDTYRRENYSLCWKCHDASLVEGGATAFRNGTRNLHQVHVMELKRGRACHLCHTPHAARRPHLISETITFGSWTGEFDFEATSDGGTCNTPCHRPKEYKRANR